MFYRQQTILNSYSSSQEGPAPAAGALHQCEPLIMVCNVMSLQSRACAMWYWPWCPWVGFPPMRTAHCGVLCCVVTMLLSRESCPSCVVSTLAPAAGAFCKCEPLIVACGVVVSRCCRCGVVHVPCGIVPGAPAWLGLSKPRCHTVRRGHKGLLMS
jgi:hypothetical protein